MSGWLTTLGPEGSALALLLLGHVLADFTLQTDEMAGNKHQLGPLLSHTAIVVVVHTATFLPFLAPRTAFLIGLIGVSHLVTDALSAQIRERRGTSLWLFLGDQLTHVAIIVGGWYLLDPSTWASAPVTTALGGAEAIPWATVTTGAVYLSAFAFAHQGGNSVVRRVLPADGPESGEDDLEAGSLIGTLERWIIVLLGLAGRWESAGLVIAAKSIARFEELKERAFAEYFLVGTLASVLVALFVVAIVSLLL